MKIYYGNQTKKALENFQLTGRTVDFNLIIAMAEVKKATAIGNANVKKLSTKKAEAIIKACNEIINGNFKEQFKLDVIQGGAGTSINMNVNEVIAERASEILKKKEIVHYLDDVNMSQSTNDAVPTAIKITVLKMLQNLIKELETLAKSLRKKEKDFSDVIKVARTHLQDAVPITLGQEFGAYASACERNIIRIKNIFKEDLLEINLGGTAIGTGILSSLKFAQSATKALAKETKLPLKLSKNLIDNTQNVDIFVDVSSRIKTLSVVLSKMANDLRLMASGPRAGFSEIILEEKQKGSTIMPGKVNPVMLEMLNQAHFHVSGNDLAITRAAEAGQFSLNVFLPIVAVNLFESIRIMTNAVKSFESKALRGIKANKTECKESFDRSLVMATALNPYLGYDKVCDLVKEALKTNKNIPDLVLEKKLLSKVELDKILDIKKLTTMQK